MRKGVLLLAGFAGGLVGFHAMGASGAWKRIHGGDCQGAEPTFDGGHVYWSFGPSGLIYQSGSGSPYASAICPLSEADTFQKTSITGINVHGEDRSTTDGVQAQACFSFWSSTGGNCGSPYASGNSFLGQFTGHPDLSLWGSAHANDFGYIYLRMPAPTVNGVSSVHGISLITP